MLQQIDTKILRSNAQGLADAASLLESGELVAFPTETVYGLGADATNGKAVARIFAAKARPQFNPLIVHLPDKEAVTRYVNLPKALVGVADAFWPGPLTLVAPRREDCEISELVSAGLPSIAIRVPKNPTAIAFLRAFNGPVAAPSANPSGAISPTTAEHVIDGLGGKIAAVLDGGACNVGLESTILGVEEDRVVLLRPGGLAGETIETLIGYPLKSPSRGGITAPGQLASHYAPNTGVRLNVGDPEPNEAFLAFGPAPERHHTRNLSPSGDLAEAAANLFAYLRQLDQIVTYDHLNGIAVAPIPNIALGRAINDRLSRAAAPRDTPVSQ